MRDFKGMKRQRGRNRGGGGGGGNKPTHNVNRAFDSNGPDNVKIRGHAQHIFEKYQQLARDASSAGDRVLGENYLQHAEHYFRLLRTLQPQRPASEILGRDSLVSGYDIDFEDESGEPIAGDVVAEPAPEGGSEGGEFRQEGRYEQRQDGPRQDFNRQDGRREERFEGRRDEQRGEGRFEGRRDFRDRDQNRDQNRDRGEGRERNDRFEGRRDERGGENRQRFEGRRDEQRGEGRRDQGFRDRGEGRDRFERGDRDDRRFNNAAEGRADPLPVVEPQAADAPQPAYEPAADASVLRGQDGTVSEAPAFLQSAAPPAADEEGRRPRTRRPRRPRSFEVSEGGTEGEAPAPAPEVAEG